ncbi:MAG: hypothetical protein JSV91_03565 [Phycisphaerales bacterium]|nr:MAG: hypothetical protein JSV91_03565 [Phycisphaerales bacterium]
MSVDPGDIPFGPDREEPRWPWDDDYVQVRLRNRDTPIFVALAVSGIPGSGFPLYSVLILGGPKAALIVGLPLLFIGLASLLVVRKRMIRRLAQRKLLKQVRLENTLIEDRRYRRKVVQALVDCGRLERGVPVASAWRWNYPRFLEACESHHIRPPRCIVDARLTRGLRRIERMPDLLECEVIGDAPTPAGILTGVVITAIGGLILASMVSISACAAVAGGFIAFVGLSTIFHQIRQATVFATSGLKRQIVGSGALMSSGRFMVPDECLTVVRRGQHGVHVDLADRERRITLSFEGIWSAGFVSFWQRWMHPHPRPELVRQFVADSRVG